MPSLEKAIKKFLDSDGVKGQAGTWVLLSDENGDIKLYEHYGYLVGTIIDGHMIWRDNKEYYVSETYSDMILKSLYDGGLIDKYALKESTKKFSKESQRVNEGGLFADIGYRMDDGIKGLKKMFRGKPKFKAGDELEWKYPNGDEWYPFVVKDVQWIDGQWRYGDENAGTYRPHGFWRKDEWHPQGWCRPKQGTSESTKKFGRKFAKEGTESNPRFKCMESEKSDPLHICPYCGNDKVYDDPQSQDDRKIYLSGISDGGKFRVERHCSECDHYWDVVMKTTVDHIDGD